MNMELPFLKNKQKMASGGVLTSSDTSPSPLPMIADELMDALQKKDKKAAVDALRAFLLFTHQNSEDSFDG